MLAFVKRGSLRSLLRSVVVFIGPSGSFSYKTFKRFTGDFENVKKTGGI